MFNTYNTNTMKHVDRYSVQEFYKENYPISLDEYCKETEQTKGTIDFREFIEKRGLQYDLATRANWDYRYKCFKDGEIGMLMKKKEILKKKEDSFLDKTQKFLKECYNKGAVIEYEETEGKWVDLPKGLPIDFSKFEEGKIRLKHDDPTYEQVKRFKEEYGRPIVTTWELKNIPILAFCYNKGFCRTFPTEFGKRLEWDQMSIWRYYNIKEYLPETPIADFQRVFENKELYENYTAVETDEQSTRKEMIDSIEMEVKYIKDTLTIKTFIDIVNYVKWEFHNIDKKIEDLYARTEE